MISKVLEKKYINIKKNPEELENKFKDLGSDLRKDIKAKAKMILLGHLEKLFKGLPDKECYSSSV